MNAKIKASALIATVLLLAGCSNANKPAETTTAATTAAVTEAPETTTTTEATTTEATTTEAETEASDPDEEDDPYTPKEDELVLSMGGVTIYGKDITMGEYRMPEIDCGLMRVSTGTYYDSDTNPDWFVTDEFTYSGETVPLGALTEYRVGDKIGDLTVTEASTLFQPCYIGDEDGNQKKVWAVFGSYISLDGEIKLTGVARYYYDEQYGIGNGDIRFIPDSSYKGLPVPVLMDWTLDGKDPVNGYGFSDFDEKGDWENRSCGGNVCVYTDAPVLNVGNLHSSYNDDADMTALFDGGNADCTKKIEVTLNNLNISFSDQFGAGHCWANIKDIKEIN